MNTNKKIEHYQLLPIMIFDLHCLVASSYLGGDSVTSSYLGGRSVELVEVSLVSTSLPAGRLSPKTKKTFCMCLRADMTVIIRNRRKI